MGNPDGAVTVYEFFDFRCGYCRRHYPVLKQLVAANPDLKVVFKQYPILDTTADGPSRQAALAALYANSKGKGAEFHNALMSMPEKVTPESIQSVARAIGLDVSDMESETRNSRITSALDSSVYVGRELRFDGTPSYIVGDRIFSGGVGIEQMQKAIERARSMKSR